ncbi:F-box protein [Forsythia ovata]|uniref:F-box protein n=1 Tax=Forsythia ovata TaxID=205694 RepID=A0ABD1X7M2_9LAMI
MDLPEDVWIDVLVRLPPQDVLNFRYVSKKWNKLIHNRIFLRSYAEERKGSSNQLLGFFQTAQKYSISDHKPPIRVLPLLGKQIGYIPSFLGYFICSSNGLILCGLHSATYYVVNPLTKKSVSLPPPKNKCSYTSVGMICEENTTKLVANYKVVRAFVPIGCKVDNKMKIETYSSKKGKWVESILIATGKLGRMSSDAPLVINGVFHWHSPNRFVTLYNPNDLEGKNHLQIIQYPATRPFVSYNICSRTSDDILWCGQTYGRNLKIWMLPKSDQGYKRSCNIPKEEWILMHELTSNSLNNDYLMIRKTRARLHDFRTDLTLIALNPWNPSIVFFKIGETIFKCNAETKLIELVQFSGIPIADPYLKYSWIPYFESQRILCQSQLEKLETNLENRVTDKLERNMRQWM